MQVVVIIPVVTQRLVPMVLLTMEIPQLQFIDKVTDVLVCRSSKFLRCSL